MKPVVAILYAFTGLSLVLLDLVTTGAMLGMTDPISPWTSVMWVSLFALGPCLLILGGCATATKSESRLWWLLGITCLIVVLLSAWTVPRIGWSYAASMFIVPYVLAFGVAIGVVNLAKRAWLVALLGALMASPVACGAAYTLYHNLFGNGAFAMVNVWIFLPGVLVLTSAAASIKLRLP